MTAPLLEMELVGASITELEDTASPGVHYYNIHAWGYNVKSGGTCNTMFQSKYSFEISDKNGACEQCYADKPSVAYFHIVQKQATDNHVLQIYTGKGYGIDIFYSGDPNGPTPNTASLLTDRFRLTYVA